MKRDALLLGMMLFVFAPLAVGQVTHTSDTQTSQNKKAAPTLVETFNYIRDKLVRIGEVRFVMTGDGYSSEQVDKFIDVSANPNTCSMSIASRFSSDSVYLGKHRVKDSGTETYDFHLKDISNIKVQSASSEGDSFEPEIFEVILSTDSQVIIERTEGTFGNTQNMRREAMLRIPTEDLANRIAKALNHAAELCGAGNEDPF